MKRVRTPLLAATVIGSLAAAGVATAPGAQASDRHLVTHTKPTWVNGAHSLGAAPKAKKTSFKVYLAPRGGLDALKADVAAVATPGSATYHHYLTPAQYHAEYDATTASVKQVSGFLRQNGLTVRSVEAHHRYLVVRGSNENVQKAFGVSLKRFNHQGQQVQANTTAVKVPAALAGNVLTVTGLDTTAHAMSHNGDNGNQPAAKAGPADSPSPGFRNARPCSTFYGQLAATYQGDYRTALPKFQGKTLPYAVCGYTGPQLRSAYEGAAATGDKALTGKGVTVAITDAYNSPTIAKDAEQYASTHGDGSYAPGQLIQNKPTRGYRYKDLCGPQGWYGEQTLDVEAVHAMAPDATVAYYPSASCVDDDFLATLQKVADDGTATVVSNSWGDLEQNSTAASVNAYEQIFMQGNLEGMTWAFSSGDNGDELANTALKQADYPTSDPYVTSVGGTSDAIGADGAFKFQTGWGTEKDNLVNGFWKSIGFTSGAGGGFSNLFGKPDYQAKAVPGTQRGVPDLALDADPTTGFLVGQTQDYGKSGGIAYGEYRIGGTSLASPLFAGMLALASQNAKTSFGQVNPALYALAGTASYRDIKGTPPDPGNVRVDFADSLDATGGLLYSVREFNKDSSLKIGPGWVDVTGVGSPTPTWLTSLK